MTLRLEHLDNYLGSGQTAALKRILAENDRFILTTHVHPDGDGLGSELSLYLALQGLGKEVCILNHNAVPKQYDFLNPNGIMDHYDPEAHQEVVAGAQVCIVLDVGDWSRLRRLGRDVKLSRAEILCIDHHPSDSPFGDTNIIHPRASSTGEILFLILMSLGIPFTKEIATGLYTAILTDTGSFRYTNTTENCHKMAGYLIGLGVDHIRIYQQVYEREPVGKVTLLAELLSHLTFECDDKVVWCAISRDMLASHGIQANETDGLSDIARRIDGVEISILFLEIEDNLTKISFRSNGAISIKGLAASFGGGGHEYASGALVHQPLRAAVGKFKHEICSYYRANLPA